MGTPGVLGRFSHYAEDGSTESVISEHVFSVVGNSQKHITPLAYFVFFILCSFCVSKVLVPDARPAFV